MISTSDLTRTTLAVLCLAALIGGTLWVMKPFLGPTIWATMVVVATWRPMLRVQAVLRGSTWMIWLAGGGGEWMQAPK